jgi:hypothetical protein
MGFLKRESWMQEKKILSKTLGLSWLAYKECVSIAPVPVNHKHAQRVKSFSEVETLPTAKYV